MTLHDVGFPGESGDYRRERAVTAVSAFPARIGARRPVAQVLRAE